MPLLAVATTVTAIQDAFVTAMSGLTPRVRAEVRWKLFEQDRGPMMGSRWYRFEWDFDGITEQGFQTATMSTVDMTCSVVADYGSFQEHEVDAVANDDHQQLADVLDGLRRTTDGLRRVLPVQWGLADTGDAENLTQIVHQFLVRYLQAKA